jgi:hypothetical protein
VVCFMKEVTVTWPIEGTGFVLTYETGLANWWNRIGSVRYGPTSRALVASVRTSEQSPAFGRPRAVLRFMLHAGPVPPKRQEGKGARRLRFGRTWPRHRMETLPPSGEMMQQKVGRIDAMPNLLLKHPNTTLQRTSEACWNTLNMLLKHVKRTPENTWKPLQSYGTSKWNTCNVCVKYMQYPDKHTCNMRLENTDETYLWNTRNICLQHVSETIATYATSPDLLLQHPYETNATYIWNV